MPSKGRAPQVISDFPFDLNNLFNLQYSFDTLKEAIEYLANQQRDLAEQVENMKDTSGGGGGANDVSYFIGPSPSTIGRGQPSTTTNAQSVSMDSKDGNPSENPNNQVDINEFKHILGSLNETLPDEDETDGSNRRRKMPEITVTKVVEYKQTPEVTL